MSNSNYLCKRLEDADKPFVLSSIDDTVYIAEYGKESSDYLGIDEIRIALVPFGDIKTKEDEAIEYADVDKYQAELRAQFDEMNKKKMERECNENNMLLFKFITYAFLNYVNVDNKEILPNNPADLVYSVDSQKFKLNSGENCSVLKQTITAKDSFLVIRGKCYKLVEKIGSAPRSEVIQLKGRQFWPEFVSTSKEFYEKYDACIKKAFESKIKEFYQAEIAQLQKNKAVHSEMEQMLSATHKENADGQIGFAKIDGNHYLYIHHRGGGDTKGYYKILHGQGKTKYGWFPPLMLGINILAKEKHLKFNITFTDKNGTTWNHPRILRPLPYEHPAVLDDDLPDLCLLRGGYSYTKQNVGYAWEQRKEFFKEVKSIFERATEAIQTGWADEQFGKSYTYHGGITGAKFNRYHNLKMPIGWADNNLRWGF